MELTGYGEREKAKHEQGTLSMATTQSLYSADTGRVRQVRNELFSTMTFSVFHNQHLAVSQPYPKTKNAITPIYAFGVMDVSHTDIMKIFSDN